MPDKSIDCVVTSPPYDNLRTYKGFVFDFEATARELYRVMVDGGVVCWNVGDSVVDGSETVTSCKQKIYFREVLGFWIHNTMIYEKPGTMNVDNTRYTRCYEYVFVLSKGKPRCVHRIRDKRNVTAGHKSYGIRTIRKRDGSMKLEKKREITQPYGYRTNVWRCNTAAQENPCQPNEHPAQMPLNLARDLIISFSDPGDIVLDPFCGSGTTLVAAKWLGDREGIGIDLSADYLDIAIRRLGCAPIDVEENAENGQKQLMIL